MLFFKWVDEIDELKRSQLIGLFMGLPRKVQGLEKVTIRNIDHSTKGYDIILELQFTSKEKLKVYEQHPDHHMISKIAPALISNFEFIDY